MKSFGRSFSPEEQRRIIISCLNKHHNGMYLGGFKRFISHIFNLEQKEIKSLLRRRLNELLDKKKIKYVYIKNRKVYFGSRKRNKPRKNLNLKKLNKIRKCQII